MASTRSPRRCRQCAGTSNDAPLRITSTNAFASRWLAPRLGGWRAKPSGRSPVGDRDRPDCRAGRSRSRHPIRAVSASARRARVVPRPPLPRLQSQPCRGARADRVARRHPPIPAHPIRLVLQRPPVSQLEALVRRGLQRAAAFDHRVQLPRRGSRHRGRPCGPGGDALQRRRRRRRACFGRAGQGLRLRVAGRTPSIRFSRQTTLDGKFWKPSSIGCVGWRRAREPRVADLARNPAL